MSVKFYITKDKDGVVLPYRKPYENMAVLQVAKSMWRTYRDTRDVHFAIVANVQNPPIDLAIISTFGIGIIDFKHALAPVEGKHDSEWYYLNEHGKRTGDFMLAGTMSSTRKNPYHQVQEYKDTIHRRIKAAANNGAFPKANWLSQKFRLQGAVVFTSIRFDTKKIIMDLPSHSWFSFRWPTDIAGWAQELSFDAGHNNKISPELIHTLATSIFSVEDWTEISGHLSTRDPFAQLSPIIDGVEGVPYLIDQDEVSIGRSPQNLLSLPSFPSVSQFHATVYRTSDGNLYIRDNNSTNGTYLNHHKLDQQGLLLHDGDTIILGKHLNGVAKLGSCTFRYSTLSKSPIHRTKFQSTG